VLLADWGGDRADISAIIVAAELCSELFSDFKASTLTLSVLTTALAKEFLRIARGVAVLVDDDPASTLDEESFAIEPPNLKTDFAAFFAKLGGGDREVSKIGMLILLLFGLSGVGCVSLASESSFSNSSTSPSSARTSSEVIGSDGEELFG
jgi:hypothetical protein